jgi:hypothetical protein
MVWRQLQQLPGEAMLAGLQKIGVAAKIYVLLTTLLKKQPILHY